MGHFGHLLVVALAVLGISEANQNSRFRRATKKTDTKVKSLHVESKVMSRFATTHVRSEVHNLKAEAQEIFFEAQLPSEAFISNFTMEIDGRLEVAEVKGKEEAAKKYQEAKASGNTAGLVAQKPRETDIFRTSVNVKAKRKVKFDLTYQEVLVRRHGVYKHVVNVLSTEGIEDVEIKVIISERGKLSKLKVPKFAPKIAVKTNKELLALPDNSEATVRSSESEGVSTTSVSYEPARGKAGQLAVLYDVERSTQGGEIEVVDGFFVHFIAPQADFIDSVSADFVFVLDASGSMDGRKFSQMQEAMRTILPQLKEEDKFSLVYFSNKMTTWKQELQQAEEDNVDEALEFIENQESGGGTNIHGALLEAMQILDRSSERKRPAVIVFLTDGHPTVGEIQDAEGIKRAIKQRNRKSYRIHSLAFGDDADSTMLKQLSKENTGLFRKIFVASDAALQLDGFYSEISVPLFSNLKVTYLNSSVKTESVIKNRDDDTLYEGSEIVIVGKMKRKTVQTLKGQISAKQSDGQPVVFRCGNECFHCCNRICPSFCGPRPRCIPPLPPPIPVVKVSAAELPPNTLGGIIERMWAYQTIKKKLLNAELNPSKASKLKREAKNLAIQYNFVTELTSLVIVDKEAELKPTEDAEEEADQFMGMGGGSRGPGRFGMAGGSSFGGRISPTMVSMGSLAGPRGPSGFGGRGSSINRQKGLFGLPAPKSMTRRPRPRPTRRPRPSATWRTSSVPTSTLPTTTPPTTLATSNVPCPLNIIVLIDSRPGSRISSKKSEIFRAFSAKLRNSVKIDGEIALAYLTSDGGNIDVRSLSRINTSQSKSARGESLRNVIRSFKRQKGDFYVVVLHGRKMLPSSLKKLLQAQSSDSIVSAQLRQDSTSTGKMTEVARLSSIALFGADANKLYKKVKC